MIVELLTLGDELLDGRRVDTNTAWLGRRLTALGVPPRYRQTTIDDLQDIVSAFRLALTRSDVVISTGGLGPTQDDLTFEALAEAVGQPLEFHPDIFQKIEARFQAKGMRCPPSNRRQAMLPKGAVEIPNDRGTAPGLRLDLNDKTIFSLPGVPKEMQHLFDLGILPELERRLSKGGRRRERIYRFYGISESHLEERVEESGVRKIAGGEIRIAYTASFPEIDVTLSVLAEREKSDQELLAEADRRLMSVLGNHLGGLDDETLEARVVRQLVERNWTVAVAESMTGGLISGHFVNVSGSSKVLERSWVTYGNLSKMEELGVGEETLRRCGAVSRECALEMAAGARRVAKTSIGISSTGVAGPDGGTPEKPVGLTYLAWVGPDFEEVQEYQYRWDRNRNRMLATVDAFMGLIRRFNQPIR